MLVFQIINFQKGTYYYILLEIYRKLNVKSPNCSVTCDLVRKKFFCLAKKSSGSYIPRQRNYPRQHFIYCRFKNCRIYACNFLKIQQIFPDYCIVLSGGVTLRDGKEAARNIHTRHSQRRLQWQLLTN